MSPEGWNESSPTRPRSDRGVLSLQRMSLGVSPSADSAQVLK